MSSPINPVVSGLLHGFELAHRIKGERIQQEALARQTQLDEDNRQIQAHTQQQQDLHTRLSIMAGGGRKATQADQTEMSLGQKFQRGADQMQTSTGPDGLPQRTGIPQGSFQPSTLKDQMIQIGSGPDKESWIMPTPEESQARANVQAEIAAGIKSKAAQADEDHKSALRIEEERKKREVSVPADIPGDQTAQPGAPAVAAPVAATPQQAPAPYSGAPAQVPIENDPGISAAAPASAPPAQPTAIAPPTTATAAPPAPRVMDERVYKTISAQRAAEKKEKAAAAQLMDQQKFAQSQQERAQIFTAGQNDKNRQNKLQAASLRAQAGTGSPEDNASVAQGIADYRLAPPSLARGANKAVMAKVLELNPSYDGTFFPTAQKTQNAFTSGTPAKSVNAINTALSHLGTLSEASEALRNNDIKVLNRIANTFGEQVGKDPVTTYKTIVHRVGPELVTAYVGAGGGQGERALAEKDFDPANGPDQLKSNIAISAKLLESKAGALQKQYSDGTQGRGKLNLLSALTKVKGGGAKAGPAAGTIEGGYKFKGGDPADKTNWVKQ